MKNNILLNVLMMICLIILVEREALASCRGCNFIYCQCNSTANNATGTCVGNQKLICTTDCGAFIPNNENCNFWCAENATPNSPSCPYLD